MKLTSILPAIFVLGVLASTVLTIRRASADQVAITSVNVTGWVASVGFGSTVGSLFQVTTNLSANELGIWDQGGDGLQSTHAVGLWDESQTLLRVATVPSGSAGVLISGFRYVSIPPVLLVAGKTYVLGAFYSPTQFDPFFAGGNSTFSSDPHVTWHGSVETLGLQSGISYPATLFGDGETFGPSFGFAAVPEPTSGALAAFGLAGLLVFLRCRR